MVAAFGGGLMLMAAAPNSQLAFYALCTLIPAAVYAFVTRMSADHDAERREARGRGIVAGESLWSIAKSYRQFWLLCASIFVVSSAAFGLMSQVVPMTTDKGIGRGTAAHHRDGGGRDRLLVAMGKYRYSLDHQRLDAPTTATAESQGVPTP